MNDLTPFFQEPVFDVSDREGLIVHYPFSSDKLPPMPRLHRADVPPGRWRYVGIQNTHLPELDSAGKIVGFFREDESFSPMIRKPWRYRRRLSQYPYVWTPDISLYTDMPLAEAWVNTYWNRAIGRYWQNRGIKVIPTVSWGNQDTFSFCFDGIEPGSCVAVSTIKTCSCAGDFMNGFVELCKKVRPCKVFCYCKPFREMYGYADIIYLEHEGTRARREARFGPMPGQQQICLSC
ncbi:MAG: DUF4417 domain-containing protein [Coriobacteriales bacterium]|nr:DUF4417 domain-containing protein [Coriobacteriales bacterium]